jgi:hypothetical protein
MTTRGGGGDDRTQTLTLQGERMVQRNILSGVVADDEGAEIERMY